MSNQANDVVHEFEAGYRGTVRASITHFKGNEYLDIRLWVEPRENPGADLIPTGKGLSLPLDYIDDLVEAAAALERAAKRQVRSSSRRNAAAV